MFKKLVLAGVLVLCMVSIAFSAAIKNPVVIEVNITTYTEVINTSAYCKTFSIWLQDGTQFIYSTDGTDNTAAYSPDGALGLTFPNSSVQGASVMWIKSISGTVDCIFQPGE